MRDRWHFNDACWYAQVSTPPNLPPVVRILEGTVLRAGKKPGTVRVKFPHAPMGLDVETAHIAPTPTAAAILLNGKLKLAIAKHQYHIDQLRAAAAEGTSRTIVEWAKDPIGDGREQAGR